MRYAKVKKALIPKDATDEGFRKLRLVEKKKSPWLPYITMTAGEVLSTPKLSFLYNAPNMSVFSEGAGQTPPSPPEENP